MNLSKSNLVWLIGLLLLFVTGAAVRFNLLSASHQAQRSEELPFTLESALHFRLHEMVYLHGKLPKLDRHVEYPQGVKPAEMYSISSEYVYGMLAHLMPDRLSLTAKIRILQVLWFCMGIPALAVAGARLTGSRWAGWLAGLMYAVSLASVIRSTGLEISRENFALPLMLIHLACWLAYLERPTAVLLTASAVFLAAAMVSWDLIQVYLLLWVAGYGLLPALRGDGAHHDVPKNAWLVHVAVLALAGVLHPYLRSHAFHLSVGMLLLYGVTAFSVLSDKGWGRATQRAAKWAVLLGPLVLGVCLARSYAEGYGHFGELLVAKIRFLNMKPADPSLLTYAQRIMWVPALHSADWRLTRMLFPTTVWLSLLGVALILITHFFKHNKNGIFFLLGYVVWLVLFIFFVRFHVFLIPFASLMIAASVEALRGKSVLLAGILSVVLLGAVSLEARQTLQGEWGRSNVYYPELVDLTNYLDQHIAPEPVLANFGVSASILAYGRCPILLHPKFETESIRARVRDYAEVLFKGSEQDFRDWADRAGARYYVHAMGSYAEVHPEYQMRYFVDALEPAPDAAAWVFETAPETLIYFQSVFSNRKYHLYRMITRDMQEQAADLAIQAVDFETEGQFDRAFEMAQAALAMFPHEPVALKVADRVSVGAK